MSQTPAKTPPPRRPHPSQSGVLPMAIAPVVDRAYFEREAHAALAAGHRMKAAEAFHEAAWQRRLAGGSHRDIVADLTEGLKAAPGYLANSWALQYFAEEHQGWEELARVLEARASFCSFPSPRARADTLVQRVAVLAEHVDDLQSAAAGVQNALAVDPDLQAAWVAGVVVALRRRDVATLNHLLARMTAALPSGSVRRAWLGAALRASLKHQDPGLAQRDFVAFLDGLDAQDFEPDNPGAGASELAEEIDALSLRLNDPGIRFRVLHGLWQGLRTHPYAPGGRGHALAVVAARQLVRAHLHMGRFGDAWTVVRDVESLWPEEPWLAGDRFAVVLRAADSGALDGLTGFQLNPRWNEGSAEAHVAADRALAALDAALVAERAGRVSDALETLAQIEDHSGLAGVAHRRRCRLLTVSGEWQELAAEFENEAERLLRRPLTAGADEVDWQREAAHLLVRGATIWEVGLADGQAACVRYERALQLYPGYRPAIEGLGAVYARDGRWDELTGLVENDLSAALGSEREEGLAETLLLLNRDVLSKYPQASQAAKRLTERDGEKSAFWVALVESSALALFTGGWDDTFAANMSAGVQWLCDFAPDDHWRARWAGLAGLCLQGTGAPDRGRAWFEKAVAWDPTDPSLYPLLDLVSHDPRAQQRLLVAAIDAHATVAGAKSASVQRALRFRLALVHAQQGGGTAVLETLRADLIAGDVSAADFALELLRQEGRPDALLQLHEMISDGDRPDDPWVLLVLAEALEQRGDAADAFARFEAARVAAGDDRHVGMLAAFGLLRTAALLDKRDAVGQGLAALAGALGDLEPGSCARLDAEAKRFRAPGVLFNGQADDSTTAGLEGWMQGVGSRDLRKWAQGFANLAAQVQVDVSPAAAAPLWLWAGLASLGREPEGAGLNFLARCDEGPWAALARSIAAMVSLVPGAPVEMTRRALQGWAVEKTADVGTDTIAATCAWLDVAVHNEGQAGSQMWWDAIASGWAAQPDDLQICVAMLAVVEAAGEKNYAAVLCERIADTLKSPDAKTFWLRRGEALAAADTVTDVLIRVRGKLVALFPDDQTLLDGLSDDLHKTGNWRQLERLVGFRLGRLTDEQENERLTLLLHRADLRLHKLNDEPGGVRDLRRYLAVRSDCPAAALMLGRAALQAGQGAVAQRWLQVVLDHHEAASGNDGSPHPAPDERVGVLLDLAESLSLQGDNDRAAALLQAPMQKELSNVLLRQRWLALMCASGQGANAAEQLKAYADGLQDGGPSSAQWPVRGADVVIAGLWAEAGETWQDVVDEPSFARGAYLSALRHNPSLRLADKVALLGNFSDLSSEHRVQAVAVLDRLTAWVVACPDALELWPVVLRLNDWRGDRVQAGLVAQAWSFVDPGAEPPAAAIPLVNPATDLQALHQAVVSALVQDGALSVPPDLVRFVVAATPALGAAFSHPLPAGMRLKRGRDEKMARVELLLDRLGVEDFEFCVRPGDATKAEIHFSSKTVVAIDPGALASGFGGGFRMARALVSVLGAPEKLGALPVSLAASWLASTLSLAGAPQVRITQGSEVAVADTALVKAMSRACSRRRLATLKELGSQIEKGQYDVADLIALLGSACDAIALHWSGDLVGALQMLRPGAYAADGLATEPRALGLLSHALIGRHGLEVATNGT